MADDDTTNGGSGGSGGGGGEAQGSGGKNERPYGVFTEVEIKFADFEDDPAKLLQLLKETVGKDPDKPDQYLGRAVWLVRMGKAKANDPRAAIKKLGEARDLNGDFEVIADSARNAFPNVRAGTRRVVEIG